MKKLLVFCLFLTVALVTESVFAGDWKPNFALQLYSYRMMTFEDAVKTAGRQGFKFVEIYPGHKLAKDSNQTLQVTKDPTVIKKIKDIMAAARIKPVGYGVIGAENEAQWREIFEFVKALNIGIVLIEAGKDVKTLTMVDRLAGEYGVKVAIHNHKQEAGLPENILKELNGYKNIGSGADTGHWAVAGIAPLEGVKKLAGKFNSMHLVDEKNIGKGSYVVPYGQGACQIDKILDELKKQGYTGPLSVEYERDSDKLIEEVSECLKWYNAYFEK